MDSQEYFQTSSIVGVITLSTIGTIGFAIGFLLNGSLKELL